jgi:DNA (cytosine-5)-methyltransferase 1
MKGMKKLKAARINFLDLFAGAGGLSEGFIEMGCNSIGHIEKDAAACDTLRTRIAYYECLKRDNGLADYKAYLKQEISRESFYELLGERPFESVIQAEISWETIADIFERIDKLLGKRQLDIILGGPPCQAYSVAGRARDPESMTNDRRNFLYQYYAEFLRRYSPRYFVFENVLGLLSAGQSAYFEEMKSLFRYCGYEMDWKVLNASDYGVLQDRRRVFLVGKRGTQSFTFNWPKAISHAYELVQDLFPDLPSLKSGEYDSHGTYAAAPSQYLKDFKIRRHPLPLTQHFARPNQLADLEIYRIASVRMLEKRERIKYDELPEALKTHRNKSSFLDRFKVLDPFGNAHTIVAHIAKDGHHYIHPDPLQNRSITLREAARIQSFPDDYYFEGSRTAAFQQIGNAVPPILAAAIAKALIAASD